MTKTTRHAAACAPALAAAARLAGRRLGRGAGLRQGPGHGGAAAQARHRPLLRRRPDRGRGGAGRDRRQGDPAGALAGDRGRPDRVHQQPRGAEGRRDRDRRQRRQRRGAGPEARGPAGRADDLLRLRRRQGRPHRLRQPGQVRQPRRADAGEHGQADRLRGRVRDPLLDADGDEPERLDRLHEEEAQLGAQVREDEAGPGRLRRGERAGQPAAGAGPGRGVPEPQGDHRPGRHRPAGGRARLRAGEAPRTRSSSPASPRPR